MLTCATCTISNFTSCVICMQRAQEGARFGGHKRGRSLKDTRGAVFRGCKWRILEGTIIHNSREQLEEGVATTGEGSTTGGGGA